MTPSTADANKKFFDEVVKRMRVDQITNTVRNDQTLVTLGSKLFRKYKKIPHMVNEISQKLRILGKLLIKINQEHPTLISIKDIVMPESFPIVMQTVEDTYLRTTNTSPTTAIKIGQHLMKCANILIVQCIVDGNRNVRQKLDDFITLYEKEWSNIISTKARQIFL